MIREEEFLTWKEEGRVSQKIIKTSKIRAPLVFCMSYDQISHGKIGLKSYWLTRKILLYTWDYISQTFHTKFISILG